MNADLTPETLAELHLAAKELTVLKIGFDFGRAGGQWRLVMDSMEALLDAAAERDQLREMVRSFGRTIDRWGKLIIAATASEDITTPDGDGDWQVIEERLAEVPALLAERDALAAKVERLTGELVDAGYRQGEDRAERDALRSMIAGRCLSGITHRDEEHRQSVCMLPEGHAPLMHDDCMGCTWTDADHWEPSAIDALADRIERVRDWLDHRGVDVSDRDDDYMRGYRAAQRHALLDAAELRAELDAGS